MDMLHRQIRYPHHAGCCPGHIFRQDSEKIDKTFVEREPVVAGTAVFVGVIVKIMVSRRAFGGIVPHGLVCHFEDGILVITAVAFNEYRVGLPGMHYRSIRFSRGLFGNTVIAALVDHVGLLQGVPRIGVEEEIFQSGIAHGPAFVVLPVLVDKQLESGAFAPAFIYFENHQGMIRQARGLSDFLQLNACPGRAFPRPGRD